MDKWFFINTGFLILLSILALANISYFKKLDPFNRVKFAPYFYWTSMVLIFGFLLVCTIVYASENSGHIVLDAKNVVFPLALLFIYSIRVRFCKKCGATANKGFSKGVLYCSKCGSILPE